MIVSKGALPNQWVLIAETAEDYALTAELVHRPPLRIVQDQLGAKDVKGAWPVMGQVLELQLPGTAPADTRICAQCKYAMNGKNIPGSLYCTHPGNGLDLVNGSAIFAVCMVERARKDAASVCGERGAGWQPREGDGAAA